MLKAPTIELLRGDASGYVMALANVFRAPLALSLVAATIVIALMLIGIVVVLTRRGSAQGGHPGLRGRAARVPLSLLRISRKEGHRFTASRSMVSRHVGPLLVKQDVVNFPSMTLIRQ